MVGRHQPRSLTNPIRRLFFVLVYPRGLAWQLLESVFFICDLLLRIAGQSGIGEGCFACQISTHKFFDSHAACLLSMMSSAAFARTSAAAMGGHTEFPHMRTWASFDSLEPSGRRSMR